MKLRTRVFLQFLVPILTLYGLLIGISLRYLGNSFLGDALNQKRAAMVNVSRGMDDWLLSRVSEVLQLSRIPLFENGDDDEILDYMADWQDTLSFIYDHLYLVEQDGTWRSVPEGSGSLEDPDYLERFFSEGQLFAYAGPNRYLGEIFADHFIIGAPLKSPDGTTQGILTATVTLETLTRIFGFFSFEDFESWMLVNPDGIIIVHEDPLFTGKEEKAVFGKSFLRDQAWGDMEAFVTFMRNGWKMVAFVPSDTLMAPFRQAFNLVISLASILVLLVILIILILSTTVSRPIKSLTEGVHCIMGGDYSRRVESSASDEVAELADSFNRLASRMTTLRTDDRFSFLGHVAARMAHELRKPLHVIQLAAKALEKEDSDRSRYLNIIDEEIASADRFVAEILAFSHDESLDRQFYSPENLISRVLEKFRLLAEGTGITIRYDSLTAIPEVYIDVMQLEEVFSNILQNAMDSILAAGTENDRDIHISADLTNEKEIRIRFEDTGDGFDRDLIDRYFDPYFTTREKGTGLGLSLSYRILMAHGARIILENCPAGGLVSVYLPA